MARERGFRYWACAVMATIVTAAGTAIAINSHATEGTASEQLETAVNYRIPDTAGLIRPPDQPIPFSHAQHVGKLTLDCGFCHVGAGAGAETDERTESGKHMTFPETRICMNCHGAIAVESPDIVKLTEFHTAGDAVPWSRVYSVLHGVNWTHKPHLDASIPCESCHGKVAELEVMTQVTAVTAMASCVNCHRANRASSQCDTCHIWPAAEDFQRWSVTLPTEEKRVPSGNASENRVGS